MIVLGIDPGASGGLAFVKHDLHDGKYLCYRVDKTPDTERDIYEAIRWSNTYSFSVDLAVIEHVHSMPAQGVASSFKFGRSYGFLRGCLIASGIPFTEVTPQKWQKALSCMSKGDKNVTKARAQQLFPDVKVTHAVADALLLAYYGRFVHQPSTHGA